MRVHTKIVWDWSSGEVLEDEWFAHDGPVAQCGNPGSGSSTQKVVQQGSTGPWSVQQPYLQQGFEAALANLNSGMPRYYDQYNTNVLPHETTKEGVEAGEAVARQQQLPQAAIGTVNKTLQGEYLGRPEAWRNALENPNANLRNDLAGWMNPYAGTQAYAPPNANAEQTNPYAGVINQNTGAVALARNEQAGVINQNAGATSDLATNSSARASNPFLAGIMNPFAGMRAETAMNPMFDTRNSYLEQEPNAYIDQLANSVGRTVTPQVTSRFAGSGRSGDSPMAQQAIAKGISDTLAPYMFGSAEAEMGRRFSGGEAAAGRRYGAGESFAQGMRSAAENQASRLYGAGSEATGRLFGSGEALAGREFAAGETEAQRRQAISDAQAGRRYEAGEAQAGRQFTAGESEAARLQAIREADQARRYEAGQEQTGRLFTSGENYTQRQFGAGADLAQRQQAASEARAGRDFSAGDDLAQRRFQDAESSIARRYGSSQSALEMGMGAYEAERDRMMGAAGMAPELESSRYMASDQLRDLGAERDQWGRNQMEADIEKFNYEQNLPMQKLANYMALIEGDYGAVSSGLQNNRVNTQQPFAQTFAQFGQGMGK